MIKKILSLFFILTISLGVAGCQLAKEDDEYKEMENVCGAFVTYTLDGEEEEYYGDNYEKRYYGEIIDKEDYKYVKFKDLEGESIVLHKEEKDGESYNAILASKTFQDIHLNVNVQDNTDYNQTIYVEGDEEPAEPNIETQVTENKISGTLYVTSKFKGIVNINPIIKDGDKYYTQKQSSSIYVDGENGGITSSSQSSSISSDGTNKNKETETFTCDINIKTIDEVKNIRVKEMSKDDKLISTKEIKHTSDTYKYKIGKNTEYVIVEETCINTKGKEIKKRTIYDRSAIENESAIHMCAYVNKDYLVMPKYLDIIK